jgi:predicted DNA-binding transcriptional regulator AlpA
MRLIDFLATGKQIKVMPKSDIPSLLGEIETLKAMLWARLIEWEGVDPVTVKDKKQTTEKPAKEIPKKPTIGPEGRILRIKEVVKMIGLSRSTVWNMHKEGRFPKKIVLGPRSVGWLDTEVYG